jgi:hypothetical protein
MSLPVAESAWIRYGETSRAERREEIKALESGEGGGEYGGDTGSSKGEAKVVSSEST